jgi:hypothetical protein
MASTNGHGTQRAILYARVSPDEQAEKKYSLQGQLRQLREHAVEKAYYEEVVTEAADDGYEGDFLLAAGNIPGKTDHSRGRRGSRPRNGTTAWGSFRALPRPPPRRGPRRLARRVARRRCVARKGDPRRR